MGVNGRGGAIAQGMMATGQIDNGESTVREGDFVTSERTASIWPAVPETVAHFHQGIGVGSAYEAADAAHCCIPWSSTRGVIRTMRLKLLVQPSIGFRKMWSWRGTRESMSVLQNPARKVSTATFHPGRQYQAVLLLLARMATFRRLSIKGGATNLVPPMGR